MKLYNYVMNIKAEHWNFIQILSLLRPATVTFRPTLRASLSSNSFISFILLINHVEDVQGTANFIQILSLLRLVHEYFSPHHTWLTLF